MTTVTGLVIAGLVLLNIAQHFKILQLRRDNAIFADTLASCLAEEEHICDRVTRGVA